MAKVFQLLPEIKGEEMIFVQTIFDSLSPENCETFSTIYRARRKSPELLLIGVLIGFFGVAGIQRFLTDQIGMGILYLFTFGLCFIGTIVDLVNYQQLALEYNIKIAQEVKLLLDRG